VTLVKSVSDRAGSAAARSWKESVDACAEELGAWIRAELLS
jgi:adenosylhomocysteine nucleosidase